MIESLNAVTLATRDMGRSVRFYVSLGFELASGGEDRAFSSFRVGPNHLSLVASEREVQWWGRIIFYVDDVDRTYERAVTAGLEPSTRPRDAEWGERYFHVTDPDGHELSFARPLERK